MQITPAVNISGVRRNWSFQIRMTLSRPPLRRWNRPSGPSAVTHVDPSFRGKQSSKTESNKECQNQIDMTVSPDLLLTYFAFPGPHYSRSVKLGRPGSCDDCNQGQTSRQPSRGISTARNHSNSYSASRRSGYWAVGLLRMGSYSK